MSFPMAPSVLGRCPSTPFLSFPSLTETSSLLCHQCSELGVRGPGLGGDQHISEPFQYLILL